MQVTWTEVKAFIIARSVSAQYVSLDNKYYISVYDGLFNLNTIVLITTPRNTDQIDFEDNYLSSSNVSPVKLPISAVSFPLPTGAATEATLAILNGKVTTVNTGAVVVSSSALPTGASTEATLSTLNSKVTTVNTGAVVISSSALPSGASTSALQTTGNTSLSSIDGKIPANLTVTSTRLLTDSSGVTQPISGTITANAGTNLNTSLLALESGGNLASIKTDVDNLNLSQGSSTSGQKGNLILGAVTTAAPTYITTQSNPLSLTTTGALRTDASGTTQPISGTIAATQSGTWTIQPGNTANTTPWLSTINQGGNSATVTASNALKIDGSAVTQPVSGTFFQATQPISGTVSATQSGTWNITNISGTISLPTGAATSANQSTEITSLQLIDNIIGPVTPGAVATGSALIGGQFNTALPTLTNTQQGSVQLDSSSRLIVAPLTNSSIVKAQLQDNNGTAVTLGSTTSANSLPVSVATDSITGNITANGQSVTLNTNGASQVGLIITGTWTGTLQVEVSIDGTNFVSAFACFVDNLSGDFSALTSNGSFLIPSGGYKQVRIRASAFASGTATITMLGTPGPNLIRAINLQSSSFLAQTEGVAVTGAVASQNPILLGARYNATPETFGDTALVRLLADANARLVVTTVPRDGVKTTYSASSSFVAPVTTATDIFTLTGSGTKTIRVTKLIVSATQTTGGIINFFVIKRSAANSGGTSNNLVETSHDSTNAGATATALSYTANPASLGATVGNLRTIKIFGSTLLTTPIIYQEDFGALGQAIVLRGTSEVLAVNLNSASLAGNNFDISIEWTEE